MTNSLIKLIEAGTVFSAKIRYNDKNGKALIDFEDGTWEQILTMIERELKYDKDLVSAYIVEVITHDTNRMFKLN